jgi:hypothetical protein
MKTRWGKATQGEKEHSDSVNPRVLEKISFHSGFGYTFHESETPCNYIRRSKEVKEHIYIAYAFASFRQDAGGRYSVRRAICLRL